MAILQRRINVDATSRRCIDVDATLSKRYVSTGRDFVIFMKLKIYHIYRICLFVLRFYGPVNPLGSCRARSVYLTTHLLGRLSPPSR